MKAFTRNMLVGESPAFRATLKKAARLKGHKANVLITGKSGSGKELLARFIHCLEEDKARPFVAINCAAIPDNLIESELFGHERGAFTGAFDRKIGKFELANGGDIFLDEIATLKPALQAKLLRVLQEKSICRLGGKEPIHLSFRVIAATNASIIDLIDSSDFREDLYHRLAVVEMTMPSLKDRQEDIPLLTEYFLNKYSISETKKQFSQDLIRLLCEYEWPGNIRELENVVHNLIIMTKGDIVDISDLPERMMKSTFTPRTSIKVISCKDLEESIRPLKGHIDTMKEEYVLDVMDKADWDLSQAAKLLQMGRSTLFTYLKGLKLETKTVD